MAQQTEREDEPADGSLVFISYSHNEVDADFARQLRDAIEMSGHRPWLDERNMPAGAAWDEYIENALRRSAVIVGVMSPRSVASRNVLNEWVFAQERKIPLMLLLLEPTEIPHNFIRINYLNFTLPDKSAAFDNFRRDLDVYLRQEPERPDATYAAPQPLPVGGDESLPTAELIPLQRLHPAITPTWLSFDADGRSLRLADDKQIVVIDVNSARVRQRRALPHRRWKAILPHSWQGKMVGADWNGSLEVFDPITGDGVIYNAHYGDLPFHKLATDGSDRLLAATWNGRLLAWDATGQPVIPPDKITLAHMLLHVHASDRQTAVVSDQAGVVRSFTLDGELLDEWDTGYGTIDALWSFPVTGVDALENLCVLFDGIHLVRRRPSGHLDETHLPAPVDALSHLSLGGGDGWTALALENGHIAWLSWSSWRTLPSVALPAAARLRDLIAVRDYQRPGALATVGLSQAGDLLAVCDRRVRLYPVGQITELRVDPTGKLLCCLTAVDASGDGPQLLLFRNPAILPVPCEVIASPSTDRLVVNEYRRLTIELTNSGLTPIARIDATLSGPGRVMPSEKAVSEGHFLPGQKISLDFWVKAIEAGDVPLTLEVNLSDDVGPPSTVRKLSVHVESIRQ